MLARTLVIVGIGVLLASIALPGLIARQRSAMPLADDSDLSITRPEVAYEDNALSYLLEAAKLCQWDEGASALLAAMRRGETGDGRRVDALLARNGPALERLEAALDAPHFRIPETGEIDAMAVPAIPLDIRHLVSALEMRARLASARGRPDEAFSAVLEILRLAQRIEEAHGAILATTMLGVAFRGIGLATLRDVNAKSPPDPSRARVWNETLARHRSNPAAWKRMWAAEYQQWKKLLTYIADQLDEDARARPAPRPVEASRRRTRRRPSRRAPTSSR